MSFYELSSNEWKTKAVNDSNCIRQQNENLRVNGRILDLVQNIITAFLPLTGKKDGHLNK